MHRITVATNCYEKDVYYLLECRGIKKAFKVLNVSFFEKILTISTAEKGTPPTDVDK